MSFSAWLLHRFKAHRELLRQLRETTSLKIVLEDSNRELTAEVGDLRRQVADSQRETIHSVKSVANWISQQTYGQAIYKDGVALPAEAGTPEIVNQRVNARRVCEQMEREFLDKWDTG